MSESGLNVSNLEFVEALYEEYLKNPQSVPAAWQEYFSSEYGTSGNGAARFSPSFQARSLFNPPTASQAAAGSLGPNRMAAPVSDVIIPRHDGTDYAPVGSIRPALLAETPNLDMALRQDRVDQLIRAYRVRGHMIAKLDPLGLPRPHLQELDPDSYGLTHADMDQVFSSRTIFGTETLTLHQILERLRNTYCRSIGVEFMHIHDIEAKNWLQERMEGTENRLALTPERQRDILTRLTDASMLETFIQRKYLGKKSFSLEGAESIIPLLQLAIERMAQHGVDEVVLGMAHRGRLNVLANIMGKSPREIFREFEDLDPQLHRGRGDVKYHLGYSSDFRTLSGKKVHRAYK